MMNTSIKHSDNYAKLLFFICVILEITLNFVSHLNGNVMVLIYGTFILEISTFAIAVFFENFTLKISQNNKMLLLVFIEIQFFLYLFTSIKYSTFFFDVHKLFMCVFVIYSCYIYANNKSCSLSFFEKVLYWVVIIGLFATIYNTYINLKYLTNSNLQQILVYSFNYKSFFTARAAYGTFLNICAIISLFWIDRKRGWLYWILYIWFACNVIITAARAQIVALLIGTIMFLSHSKKYKKLVYATTVILAIYFVVTNFGYVYKFIEEYSMLFNHTNHRDTDITTGRFELWSTALDNMGMLNYFIGNGIGSKDTLMEIKQVTHLGIRLSSFHSGYVDLFFETGIFGIFVWFHIIMGVFKKVKKCPIKYKNFFISLLILILISNIFDSCTLLFTTDTLSLMSTFFVISLPLMVSNTLEANNV